MEDVTFIAVPDEECGYRARAVGHSIFTQAATLNELQAAVLDAVRCHFDEGDMPRRVLLKLPQLELTPA